MPTPSRRELLQSGAKFAVAAGLGSGSLLPAHAVEAPQRIGGAHFKVGCAAYSYRQYLQAKSNPMSLADFLEVCAVMNLDGVELTAYYFPDPPTAEYIHRLARRAFLLNLEVAGAAIGNNFCLPPGDARNKQIALVNQWLGTAADMGARQLRIFAGATPKEVDAATGRKWVIECVESCLPTAEKHGVILAMENHGGVVADADGALDILNALKTDWFGLKWDSGNFRTADPYADLAKVAQYAVTTHIKTEIAPNNGPKQLVDLPKVLSLLRAVNYRGYLLLEYEAAEEPKIAVPRTLATLQRLAAS